MAISEKKSNINGTDMTQTFGHKKRLLCLLIGSVLSQGAFGQQAAEEDGEAAQRQPAGVEEILVEGKAVDVGVSVLAVDVARFGTQVQVINADEIATGGFTNFGELAAGLIRGANVGYSPDEGEFTIRIDGGTDRDTLLLLDGVPTFDRGTPLESLWGATALDPRMIENVEIFRGGQSLYFGGNGGLGVVNAIYKRPEAGDETHGEAGFYTGDFKTREMYGNITVPMGDSREHYLMVFGRTYETDAHEIFSESAYVDNILALGGKHDFPYSYNSIGMKYLWAINDDTELRFGYQFNTVDFEDSFPSTTIYTPNFTEFPMWEARFKTSFTDQLDYEAEAYYTDPRLKNTEFLARVCNIPRLADLPANVRAIAGARGITNFPTAASYESFAASVEGLPAGCVTNPFGAQGNATNSAKAGIYVNEKGEPYGTLANPFPIGAPMGYAIESIAGFGTGGPVKGTGDPDQASAGYVDYGFNNRLKYTFSDNIEGVVGYQNITYRDNSDKIYGMSRDKVESNGIYGELRVSTDYVFPTNISISGRHDFNNAYNDESIWKYGLRQELIGGFYIRSSGGTSYSQPTTAEAGFASNRVANPTIETQQVEAYNHGIGINGDFLDGTFNVELGYFDTTIDNMFGSGQLQNVCINYPGVVPADINPNIVTPDAFCEFALAQGFARTQTANFNLRTAQDITGMTLDVSIDLDKWQADFTFTDMESLEPNPIFGQKALLDHAGTTLGFVVPGAAGSDEFRQSGERAEWSASMLLSYTPNENWIISLNPKWQGPEWAYADGRSSRLVDASGNRTTPDLNFGDYVVLNGSVQYFMGADKEHRFLLRAVNILDENYYERGGLGIGILSRAAVRGEIGLNDSNYYNFYGWNGKPRSFFLQYEYQF
ncbi:MAG: TonB-dependent receptor plug domain-containing protein [Pseudomonadota bacterium]